MSKWNKEVDLLSMLVYYGLTTGRGENLVIVRLGRTIMHSVTAGQTLGEEYTDIWQYSHRSQAIPPRGLLRMAMVLLPTLPRYLLGYLTPHLHAYPRTFDFLKSLPTAIELLFEANLALFYFQGRYYDPIKRLLGIRHVRSLQFSCLLHLPDKGLFSSCEPERSPTVLLSSRHPARIQAVVPAISHYSSQNAGFGHTK